MNQDEKITILRQKLKRTKRIKKINFRAKQIKMKE